MDETAKFTRRELLTGSFLERPPRVEAPGIECIFIWQSEHQKNLPPDSLPPKFGGIYPEVGKNKWVAAEDRQNILPALEANPPYQGWFPEIKRREAKLFLGDFGAGLYEREVGWLLGILEGFAATSLGLFATKTALTREKMTRRAFLKLAASGAMTGASFWLGLMPAANYLESERQKNSDSRHLEKVASTVIRLRSLTHPEDVINFFRNLVTASKLSFIGEQYHKRGEKINMVVSFGRGHLGLDNLLALGPQFCCFLLENLYPKVVFDNVTTEFENPKDLAKIARATWEDDKKQWNWRSDLDDPYILKVVERKYSSV